MFHASSHSERGTYCQDDTIVDTKSPKAKHSAKTKTDSLAISKGESLFLNRTPSQERDTVLQILMVRKDGTEFVENRKVASR